MKKIVLYAFVFLSAISAYAIDPYGSRVDYGNDSSGGGAGAVFMVILGVVGCILYYFLTKSNKNRQTVQKTESVEAQIARMEREMAQRKEREDQETKGCIIGIIIVAFFVLMIIINS